MSSMHLDVENLSHPDRALLALLGSVHAPSMLAAVFRLAALRWLLHRYQPGMFVTRDDLIFWAEDLGFAFSDAEIVAHFESMGLLAPVDTDTYRLRDAIALGALLALPAGSDASCSVDQLRSLLSRLDPAAARPAAARPLVERCVAAIRASRHWAGELTTQYLAGGMAAMPVFWHCYEDGHRAMAPIPSSLATIDTAFLLLEPVRYGFAVLPDPPQPATAGVAPALRPQPEASAPAAVPALRPQPEAVVTRPQPSSAAMTPQCQATPPQCQATPPLEASLLAKIRAFQLANPGWDAGAFFVADDDDYPGAEKPTVETTANALSLLCLYNRWCADTGAQAEQIPGAIEAAARFLVRVQLPTGGWGIYRYEDDRPPVPARAHPSMRAIEALSLVLSLAPAPGLAVAVRDSAARFVRFARAEARQADAALFWTTDFGTPDESASVAAAYLHETALMLQALVALRPFLPVDDLAQAAQAFIASRWTPDPTAVARLAFRVPGAHALAPGFTEWEPPRDILIATANRLEDPLSSRITATIDVALAGQKHGHWHDPLLDPPKAFPSNTRWFARAILAYLAYQRWYIASVCSEAPYAVQG